MNSITVLLFLSASVLATAPTGTISETTLAISATSISASSISSEVVVSTGPLRSSTTTSSSSTSTSASTSTSSMSSSSVAVSITATTYPDLSKLFGFNNTPTVNHVADSRDVAVDSGTGYAIFREAMTVILALTKCSPGGGWIKSIIQSTSPEEMGNQGGNYTTVYLSRKKENSDEWEKWSTEIDRNNLTRVKGFGFERDPDGPEFELPWWPWALIEGALEAGWSLGAMDYHWELFRILAGEEVEMKYTTGIDKDTLWNDYLSKADYTPILIEWKGEWSVVMSPDIRDGVKWLGWADPYTAHATKYDDNNKKDGRLTVFTKYDTFVEITRIMYLKDFASFDGKPKSLR